MSPIRVIHVAFALLLTANVCAGVPECRGPLVLLSSHFQPTEGLRRQDQAILRDSLGVDHPVQFVGRIAGTPEQGAQLVFVSQHDNTLHFVPEAGTRITVGGKTVDGLAIAPLVQTAKQSGGTCATECIFNYVTQLRAMGNPAETLPQDTGALWSQIYNLVSHEHLGADRLSEGTTALTVQRFNQHRFLRRAGIPYRFLAGEDRNVARPLTDHLGAGGYALLGYRTGGRFSPDSKIVDHSVDPFPARVQSSASEPTGTGQSGHAVLASGLFPLGQKPRVLIVDSAPGGKGSMYLWGEKQLERLDNPHNDAFLVTGPGRTISQAESDRSWLQVPLSAQKLAAFAPGDESMVGYTVRATYVEERGGPTKSITGTIVETGAFGSLTLLNEKGERVRVPAENKGGFESLEVQLGPASWQSHTGFTFGESPLPDVAPQSVALMTIGYGANSRTIAGEIVKREVAPGYPIYVVTEPSGTVHEVDPKEALIGVISIAKKVPGALDAFAAIESNKPVRMIDEMKAAEAARIDWSSSAAKEIPLPTTMRHGRDSNPKATQKLLKRLADDKTPITIQLPGRFFSDGSMGADTIEPGVVIEHRGEFGVKLSNEKRIHPLHLDKAYGGYFTLRTEGAKPDTSPFLDYLAAHRPPDPITPSSDGTSWKAKLEKRLTDHRGKQVTVVWTDTGNVRRTSLGTVEKVWTHEGTKYLRFTYGRGDIPYDSILRVEFPWSFFGQQD